MDDSAATPVPDDDPVSAIRSLVSIRGRHVCADPAMQEFLLGACPGQEDKIALLVRAQEARIPDDLIWYAIAPRADLADRLTTRLTARFSLSESDALWTVMSWMDALETKIPLPRLKPVLQAVSQEAEVSPSPVSQTAPISQPAPSQSAPTRTPQKPSSDRARAVPNWALGTAAVIAILVLGVVIYISTGPPAYSSRAPGVIYNLPPGYKPPTRTLHVRPLPQRPVKTAS